MKDTLESLPDAELIPLEVDYTRGAENNDELLVDGRCYDVARYCIQGKKIIYYCYYDKIETSLMAFWSVKDLPKDSNYQPVKTTSTHKEPQLRFFHQELFSEVFFQSSPVVYTYKGLSGLFLFKDIFTPPPQG